jgi:hypothetical protein
MALTSNALWDKKSNKFNNAADDSWHGLLPERLKGPPWTSTNIDRTHLEGADCGGHGRLLGAGGQLQVLPRIPGMLLLSL